MRLSILIPTYNHDCSQLVKDLAQQCKSLYGGAEIVVCDDASDEKTLRQLFCGLEQIECVRLLRNKNNMGRARTLNILADNARGDYLLIMDADALVPPEFSLEVYLEATKIADVVCGGFRHPDKNPNPLATLRYKYEREADKRRSATIRNRHPYLKMSTFSLLIKREAFMRVRFDENCTEYGYEDTLFGADLERNNVKVIHIDNPLIHVGLEKNSVYLEKTNTALRTLRRMETRMRGHSELLSVVDKLRKWHIVWFVRSVYRCCNKPLLRNLLGVNPSLKLFSFYKLGYYLSLQ